MVDLKTNYMGLELKNPIIVGSCSLTNSVDSIKELADNGAGAVILKSLFEEQIMMEMDKDMGSYDALNVHSEMYDYLKYFEKQHILGDYLKLIKDAKEAVDIPIIASINCMSSSEWTEFSKQIENAGADGLELNIFILPSNPKMKEGEIRSIYFDIIKEVTSSISIPVSIKISHYFDNVASTLQKFSQTKIEGMVLFNKFNAPDIDIEKEELMIELYSSSSSSDKSNALRWIGIMNNLVECDLCATTGINNGEDVIKFILAGASSVQIVSAIYKNSPVIINETLKEIANWMEKHSYNSIESFRGKLSTSTEKNSAIYERVQFIKAISSLK